MPAYKTKHKAGSPLPINMNVISMLFTTFPQISANDNKHSKQITLIMGNLLKDAWMSQEFSNIGVTIIVFSKQELEKH